MRIRGCTGLSLRCQSSILIAASPVIEILTGTLADIALAPPYLCSLPPILGELTAAIRAVRIGFGLSLICVSRLLLILLPCLALLGLPSCTCCLLP